MRLVVLGGVAGVLFASGGSSRWPLGAAMVFAGLSLAGIVRMRPLLTSSDPRPIIAM
jgi:hypothetical protein